MSRDSLSTETVTHDCDEGCDGSHKHKWEVEPHPDDSDYDTLVCDDDKEALEAIYRAAEKAWDSMSPGEVRTIKIRMNAT